MSNLDNGSAATVKKAKKILHDSKTNQQLSFIHFNYTITLKKLEKQS